MSAITRVNDVRRKLEAWSELVHSYWFDALRVVLGGALVLKGIVFIRDIPALASIMEANFGIKMLLIVQAIAVLHLLAGFLILIGLVTRLACLVQIPIVAGAVFFVNMKDGVSPFELVSSIVILLLLVFFLFKGSGKFSVYYFTINSKLSRLKDESEEDAKSAPLTAPIDEDGNFPLTKG